MRWWFDSDGYYSLKGLRLRLYIRLYFIIGLVLPKGFHVEARLVNGETKGTGD